MQQQTTDHQMLSRVADGDQLAFGQLYDRLSTPLYSLAVRMLGDPTEAQDAMQEVFVQIWRRASAYDPKQSTVFSWAVLMTRRRVIDRLRARGRRAQLIAVSADETEPPEPVAVSTAESASESLGRIEDAMRVRSRLNQLPSEQRQAIELAFFQDCTHAEIAAQLGEPLGTIKARIRRGLLKLRERGTV